MKNSMKFVSPTTGANIYKTPILCPKCGGQMIIRPIEKHIRGGAGMTSVYTYTADEKIYCDECGANYRSIESKNNGNLSLMFVEDNSLKDGDEYYVPLVTSDKMYEKLIYSEGHVIDKELLNKNLVFRTKEEAITATKKMLEVLKDK